MADEQQGNGLPTPAEYSLPYGPAYPAAGAPLSKTAKGAPEVALEAEEGSLYAFEDSYAASWSGVPGRILLDEREWESLDFDEMLGRDGKARTIQQVLTLPIRSAPWDIIAGPGDTGEAKFVKDVLSKPANQGGMKTPMRLLIAQALSARTYRKACFEKVFTTDDKGKIVYEKLAFRPSSTTAIARDPKTGAFRGFRQRPVSVGGAIWPNIWIDIPAQYSWVHLNNQHISASRGHSDMELIYWLHDKKQKVLFLWATFLEAQATGRYVVKAEDETRAKQYAQALRYVKNGGVLGTSSEITVDTLETGTGAGALFQDFINYLDNQMAASVLAGFTNLPDSPGGSYALSKDQSDFFLQSLTGTAKELGEGITNYVLADLVMYNFGPKGVCPTFQFGPLSEGDLDTVKALLLGFGTTPTELRVPQAFMTELTKMMGTYLDMPMDEVNKEFAGLEDRITQRMDLELQTKKVGLEAQKSLAAQGGPQAGMAKGAANAQDKMEMAKAGAKINKAVQLVQSKGAAAKAGNTTQAKPGKA
ncbi:MAG: hypothetical protein JWN15_3468 [Firmicutes bacterium]|nr:hypothetical protein [Bacillota bacterium]